ncbi:MAG: CvpA family protein [Candidatus Obscuribacterales bacterium]|nr:CvpA family protein [Candidatus Obscuribacterales bacterium]
MVWDGLVFVAFLSLCLAGWNVGLVNSWRGPLAMIVATLVTQQFYIDFGTWIAQQTLMKPDWSAFLAYLMMWLVVEIVTEIAMGLVLTWNRKERPQIMDRIGGVVLAMLRWAIICIFPLMAMQAPNNKIPEPPAKEEGLINPIKLGFQDSAILSFFTNVGKGLMPSLGQVVVSEKAPSFKPNFDKPKVVIE